MVADAGIAVSVSTTVPPTVFSAITGGLFNGGLQCTDPEVVGTATDSHAAERKAFLDDLIAGDPTTAGGRLASWLTRVVDQVWECVRSIGGSLFVRLPWLGPLPCVPSHRCIVV